MNNDKRKLKFKIPAIKNDSLAIQLEKNLDLENMTPIERTIAILDILSENRSPRLIEYLIEYFTELPSFMNFVNCPNKEQLQLFLYELTKLFEHRTLQDGEIIKRAGEEDNIFFLVLKGKITELSIRYRKFTMSKDEYIIHMIKIFFLNEPEIFKKGALLNKKLVELPESFNSDENNYTQKDIIQYIESAKKEIRESNWKKTQNIEDYIALTSFDSSKINHLDDKERFIFLLPTYIIKRNFCQGEYFGSLSYTKNNKIFSSLISRKTTEIAVIDKNDRPYSVAFKMMNNIIKENFNNVIYSFHLFQSMDRSTFNTLFSKYLSFRKVSKGEFIVTQNEIYQGVFLIKEGEFKVTCNISYNDLNGLIVTLKKSFEMYSSFISILNELKEEGDIFPVEKFILDPIYRTQEYIEMSKEVNDLNIMVISNRQLIGLNEFYHYKTEINNFNVQCISNYGEVYFIPKENFNYMIYVDKTLFGKCARMVEEKILFLVEKIKRYKEEFMKEVEKLAMKNQTYIKSSKRDLIYYKNLNNLYKSGKFGEVDYHIKAKSIDINNTINPRAKREIPKGIGKRGSLFLSIEIGNLNRKNRKNYKEEGKNYSEGDTIKRGSVLEREKMMVRKREVINCVNKN